MRFCEIDNGVAVTLTEGELESVGVRAEDFEGKNIGAAIFLSGLLVVLRELGLFCPEGDVQTRVRLKPGRCCLELTDTGERRGGGGAFFFRSPEELLDLCRRAEESGLEIEGELYWLGGRYCLVINGGLEGCTAESVACAKIKEHGELICRTPFFRSVSADLS